MQKKFLLSIFAFLLLFISISVFSADSKLSDLALWKFQSIDTMKYSRDLSREKLNDPSFNKVINDQVSAIASTGATHVAIATPYDEEFYPILKRWVDAARRNNLKVWFRGNWSGWEGWFEYEKISREEHIKKTEDFIKNHQEIFENGDVFTPCPECENGGPGDPRHNGDVKGHREFLISEYKMTKNSFRRIGKNVTSNFNSMNGDVAKLVMDKETTRALDKIVAIDHYVSTPEQLISDVKRIAAASGGRVVLGEFGAPIPDIHGDLSDEEQAEWIKDALTLLRRTPEVYGINYWTNAGSSTELWEEDGEAKPAVGIITSFYKTPIVRVKIENEVGFSIQGAALILDGLTFEADKDGAFAIPYFEDSTLLQARRDGYFPKNVRLTGSDSLTITLEKEKESRVFRILKFFQNLL